MNNQETVTISKREYRRLRKMAEKFDALCSGGVDNWEGYSESLNQYIQGNGLREDFFWNDEDEDFPV